MKFTKEELLVLEAVLEHHTMAYNEEAASKKILRKIEAWLAGKVPDYLEKYKDDPRLHEPGYRLLELGEVKPRGYEFLLVTDAADDWEGCGDDEGGTVCDPEMAYRIKI